MGEELERCDSREGTAVTAFDCMVFMKGKEGEEDLIMVSETGRDDEGW